MSKKFVFLGGGNMAEGIVRAMLHYGGFTADSITVQEIKPERCTYLQETYHVQAVEDAAAQIKEADMIIVAVLPSLVAPVAETVKALIRPEQMIMSIAAGVTLETLEACFGSEKKIVRMMPNILNQSGIGYSAITPNQHVTKEDEAFVTDVVNSLGTTMRIPEEKFDIFTSFCSTGPLWIYKFVEAMIDTGVYVGFGRQEARDMVIKNLAGVAKVLEVTGAHPVALVDAMTSPAGVTIEALAVLQKSGFASGIMDSIVAATNKAKG